MAGILHSRNKPSAFECPNGVRNVARIERGRIAQFRLAHLVAIGQRRQAAIFVSIYPCPCEVLVQNLMRSRGCRTQDPCRKAGEWSWHVH